MTRILRVPTNLIGEIFGVDPAKWPPNVYEWLGLPDFFEGDEEVIRKAELFRIRKIIDILGEQPDKLELVLSLIEETIYRANKLLDKKRKAEYDAGLHRMAAVELEKQVGSPSPVQVEAKVSPSVEKPEVKPGIATGIIKPEVVSPGWVNLQLKTPTKPLSGRHKKKRFKSEAIVVLLAVIAGIMVIILAKVLLF